MLQNNVFVIVARNDLNTAVSKILASITALDNLMAGYTLTPDQTTIVEGIQASVNTAGGIINNSLVNLNNL